MIQIKVFVFNPFQENTYVLYDETGDCIIVDAGCYTEEEKNALVSFIEKNELKPVKLVNTHCHVDHVLGVDFLMKKFNIPFEANESESNLIRDAKVHGKVFGFEVEQPPYPTTCLKEADEVRFGNSVLKVIHIPGHSMGSIALHSPEQKFIIVGDVLFKGSIGRTDLPGGDYDVIIESIFRKLLILDRDTTVLPGHGPQTYIGEEIMSNPFLT